MCQCRALKRVVVWEKRDKLNKNNDGWWNWVLSDVIKWRQRCLWWKIKKKVSDVKKYDTQPTDIHQKSIRKVMSETTQKHYWNLLAAITATAINVSQFHHCRRAPSHRRHVVSLMQVHHNRTFTVRCGTRLTKLMPKCRLRWFR